MSQFVAQYLRTGLPPGTVCSYGHQSPASTRTVWKVGSPETLHLSLEEASCLPDSPGGFEAFGTHHQDLHRSLKERPGPAAQSLESEEDADPLPLGAKGLFESVGSLERPPSTVSKLRGLLVGQALPKVRSSPAGHRAPGLLVNLETVLDLSLIHIRR